MHRFSNLALAAVLYAALAPAAAAQRSTPSTTVTDSARIRIVVSERPTRTAIAVAATPSVDIGGGTDPRGELSGVAGAVRLADGRVVIAERSTYSIKVFDARGRFVSSFGRRGGGPGEFNAVSRLELLPGDSLAVFDGNRATLTVFDLSGKVLRTQRIPSGMGGAALRGILRDGTMVLSRSYNPVFSATSLQRDSISYAIARPGRSVLDTVGTFAGTESFTYTTPDFSTRVNRPFGRVSLIAVGEGSFYIGTGDRWEIEARSPAGVLTALYRVRHTPQRVTASDVARYKSARIAEFRNAQIAAAGASGERPTSLVSDRERLYELVPYPETAPPYDSLMVGFNGELWVRDPRPIPTEAAMWIVLSSEGAATGLVELPPRFRPLEIGRDYILALTRDDDDVEHIVVHRLTR